MIHIPDTLLKQYETGCLTQVELAKLLNTAPHKIRYQLESLNRPPGRPKKTPNIPPYLLEEHRAGTLSNKDLARLVNVGTPILKRTLKDKPVDKAPNYDTPRLTILKRLASGEITMTYAQETLNVTRRRVLHLLKRHGLTLTSSDDLLRDNLLKLFSNGQITIKQITNTLNLTRQRIYQLLEEHKIPPPTKRNR